MHEQVDKHDHSMIKLLRMQGMDMSSRSFRHNDSRSDRLSFGLQQMTVIRQCAWLGTTETAVEGLPIGEGGITDADTAVIDCGVPVGPQLAHPLETVSPACHAENTV